MPGPELAPSKRKLPVVLESAIELRVGLKKNGEKNKERNK